MQQHLCTQTACLLLPNLVSSSSSVQNFCPAASAPSRLIALELPSTLDTLSELGARVSLVSSFVFSTAAVKAAMLGPQYGRPHLRQLAKPSIAANGWSLHGRTESKRGVGTANGNGARDMVCASHEAQYRSAEGVKYLLQDQQDTLNSHKMEDRHPDRS